MVGILAGLGLIAAGTLVFVAHRHCGRGVALRCALRRLKANEEQKRQVTATLDEAHSRLTGPKERIRSLRQQVIDAWSAPTLDAGRLEALEAQLFEAIGEGSQVMRDVLLRTHQVLDPSQRQKVSQWLLRHHRFCHGCHHACHC
jgi:Spy/CpxP family protein refolding chaperone